MNELLGAARISRDIDLFHDTDAAVDAAWTADRAVLETEGLAVRMLRERVGFVEALPVDEAGRCVLGTGAELYRGAAAELRGALQAHAITFHHGRIRGALPRLVSADRPA